MKERTDDQMDESADLIHHLRRGAELMAHGCGWGETISAMERAADLIAADFFQHFKPVPVSERPWERGGWCDENGCCWAWNAGNCNWWEWVNSEMISCSRENYTHSLPANAILIPTTEPQP